MRETAVLHRVLLACSTGATRLFRQNVGVAWQGTGKPVQVSKPGMVMMYPGDVILRKAQPIRMGLCVGSSDIIGWTQRDGAAVFTAIECKGADGRVRPEQTVFIDQVKAAGGIAGVVRSEDEALGLLRR